MGFWTSNEPFVIAAIIISLGYLLKRLGVLRESVGEALAMVALNVTLPAIILLNVPRVPLAGPNAILPFFAVAHSIIMVGIGLVAFRRQQRSDRGLSLAASSGYNIGLFAIPIVSGVYGAAGVSRFALIDLGNAFSIYGLSYYLAFRYSPRSGERRGFADSLRLMARSIPLISYGIAIGLNLSGISVSGFLEQVLEVPAAMNRGLSLLAVGILLRFSFPRHEWKSILPPLAVRFGAGVPAALAVLFLAPLALELRIAVASVFILPVGMTIIPFAVKFGYDRDRAAAILNIAIPVSFILFWGVWALGTFVAPR